MEYIVRKRGFKGRYHTPCKEEADDMLTPGTNVDVIDNDGVCRMSYGAIYATEVDPSLQLPPPQKLIESKESQITTHNRQITKRKKRAS